jgi:hypothetical protein
VSLFENTLPSMRQRSMLSKFRGGIIADNMITSGCKLSIIGFSFNKFLIEKWANTSSWVFFHPMFDRIYRYELHG